MSWHGRSVDAASAWRRALSFFETARPQPRSLCADGPVSGRSPCLPPGPQAKCRANQAAAMTAGSKIEAWGWDAVYLPDRLAADPVGMRVGAVRHLRLLSECAAQQHVSAAVAVCQRRPAGMCEVRSCRRSRVGQLYDVPAGPVDLALRPTLSDDWLYRP